MKLLAKINRRYAFFSVVTLLFGMILLYIFMHYFVKSNLEETLYSTKQNVIKKLNAGSKVEFAPFIEVKEITGKNLNAFIDEIKDTLIFDSFENEYDSFSQLKSVYHNGKKDFVIYIRLDNLEKSDLIFSVGLPISILLLAILLMSNFVVTRINLSIWGPFYENLEKLKSFSTSGKEKLELKKADIDEFADLNETLVQLTENARRDYSRLRDFSENASHELQTPIAIIKAKIEALLQNNIGPEESDRLHSIYKSLNRLTKLNESLTLLTKLESADYEEKKEIQLNTIVMRMAGDFSEIAEEKAVKIETDLKQEIKLYMNENLLEIILSNLFMNAVKYNLHGGKIFIFSADDSLTFKNTGLKPKKDPAKMFDRFEKDNPASESSGLGLAIVKEICEMNRYSISYSFDEPYHIISVKFLKSDQKN